MKKFWLISILLSSFLICNKVYSQDLPFEKTFKNAYNHTIEGVHKTPSGNFLVSTRSRPSLYAVELSYTFLFDSLGNQLWMKETMNPEFSVVWNYWEDREEYVFYGPPFFCDWCATGYYGEWNFYRLDEQGNKLHNDSLNHYLVYQELPPNLLEISGYYLQCLGSMLVENDAVIGVGNRFFQKVTNEGVLENYLAFSNDIIGIHQISKDEALAFGGNSIYTLNERGDLDSLLSLPFTVQKKIHVNHELVLLKSLDNTYHVIDTTGAILHNYNAELDFSEVLQIIFRDGYFWILGKNANGFELRKFSETLGYELIQNIDTLDFDPISFELWDNHFLLLGYEPDLKNRHLVLKGIEYNQPEVQIDFPDVGIEEIFPAIINSYYSGGLYYSYANISLKLKNYGFETINSLWINGLWKGPFTYLTNNCYGGYLSVPLNDLNLHSDLDTIVEFSIQIMSYSYMADGSACFWTSLPNGKRDLISENDEACSFEYVLNTSNIDNLENVNIFPNPTKDVLQIQFSSASKNSIQIQIYDLSGRLVQNETLNRGQELYQLSVAYLREGSYFVQITNGDKQSRKVFLKN